MRSGRMDKVGGGGNMLIKNILFFLLVAPLMAVEIIPAPVRNSVDSLGNSPKYTIFGEIFSGDRNQHLQVTFFASIDPYEVVTAVSGTGSLLATDALAVLSTGATTNSSASIRSRDYLLYNTGYQSEYAFTAMFPTTCVAGSRALIGPFDEEGGVQIGCDGADFVIKHSNGLGTVTTVTRANWDNPSTSDELNNGQIFTQDKIEILRLSYAWFGVATITLEWFSVGGWRTLHQFKYPGALEVPHLQNPSLPIEAYVKNTTNNTNIQLKTVSWSAWSVRPDRSPSYRQFGFIGGGDFTTESQVYSVRVTETFGGKHNHIPIKIERVYASTEGNKGTNIRVYRDCDITGGAWVKTDVDSSVTEVNSTASSVSCTKLVDILTLSKSDAQPLPFINGGLKVRPGETVTITAASAQTAEVSASATWLELF